MIFARHALVFALIGFTASAAYAQAQSQPETVTVTGDRVHLIEMGPDDTAFGLAMPLTETPRAVTVVSDTTIQRYGITGLDSLTAITPNSYTSSFFGVGGAVNLRGTLAETYFDGFKRVENRGTYDTPLDGAAEIEVLRGPPPSVDGPGKVGGLVNVVPQAGGDGGALNLTYGSYSLRNIAADYGLPFQAGGVSVRLHAYGEIDDSFSFYRGLHPSHQTLVLASDASVGGWSFSADYMYYHSNGEVQTPGWNRLTQALIDNGTYITGRNTSLTDADHNGVLTLNELGGNPYTFDPNFQALYIALPCTVCTNPAHMLDSGVGTTHLDPRTIYIAKGVDFSNSVTHTGLVEVTRDLGTGTLKLQGFVDTLENDRYVSYGYPASYRTEIGEARLRYDDHMNAFNGALTADAALGASYRYVDAITKESFNSGVIALDRRDISLGPAPNDVIASPFSGLPNALQWENNVHTNSGDAGLFAVGNLAWDQRLNVTVSGRYDSYDVRSVDLGVLSFEPPTGSGGKGAFTYSASLSYKTDIGLVPYVTNAKSSAIEIGQADEVETSLLAAKDWLSAGFLNEAGIKYDLLDDHLVGALDWYHQNRTQLAQGPGSVTVIGTSAEGAELEIRYVMDAAWSFTFAGSLQHTEMKGDHATAYLPARDAGVSPVNGFGGTYLAFDFSAIRPGNYEDTLIPHAVLSPYVTYSGENWGATFGGSYVSSTAQTVPDPIHFPSYVTLNASAFVRQAAWTIALNVNNLADARYFTPDADIYANLAALPGMGRTWRMTLKRSF